MKGNVVRCAELDPSLEASMYKLFCQQFEGVPFEIFSRDLEQKEWALLLRDDSDKLCGFTSMDIYDIDFEGRTISIVYSGDTVVSSETWRDSALSYYWMGAIDYLARLAGKKRLYWFLIVSGYRTYRFLPVYSAKFYPRHDEDTPPEVQALMDVVATARFGDAYDAMTGIVRLDTPAVLRSAYRGIPENRLSDPHIAYFAQRNPGHEQGDELVCFAVVAEEALTRIGQRMWKKGRRLFPDVDTE